MIKTIIFSITEINFFFKHVKSKSMKKIILLIPLESSYDIFLKELGAFLVENNIQVYVITKLSKKITDRTSGIHFINLDIPRGFSISDMIKSSLKLRKLLLEINPTIVHAHFQTAIMAYKLTGLTGKFISIASVHGASFPIKKPGFKRKIYQGIEYFAYKSYQKTLVMNELDFSSLSQLNLNVSHYKSKGVGCLVNKFDPNIFSKKTKVALRIKFNISDYDLVLIFVGRFTKFKGFDIVIKSMKELIDKDLNVKLILIGKVDPIHKTGLSTEEELYFKNKDEIINIGFTNDVAKYLSIADLLFFPSQKEGLPVIMMESLCMGLPVLTYNSRGCNDLIENEVNGFVMQDLDVKTYVNKINQLVDDKSILNRVRNNLNIRQAYSRENFVIDEYNRYSNYFIND